MILNPFFQLFLCFSHRSLDFPPSSFSAQFLHKNIKVALLNSSFHPPLAHLWNIVRHGCCPGWCLLASPWSVSLHSALLWKDLPSSSASSLNGPFPFPSSPFFNFSIPSSCVGCFGFIPPIFLRFTKKTIFHWTYCIAYVLLAVLKKFAFLFRFYFSSFIQFVLSSSSVWAVQSIYSFPICWKGLNWRDGAKFPSFDHSRIGTTKEEEEERRSKSPGDLLICCCRFVRRDKVQSPIYTARELSVASLGLQHQLALFGASSSSSQQRPLVKTNGTQRIVIPVEGTFWDDTPSNTADYLDYGNGREMNKMETNRDESEQMETARTSRIEDLIEYPSMDELLDEILPDSRGGDTVAMAINSNPCKKSKENASAEERKSSSTKLQSTSIFERKMSMPTQQQPPISTVNANGMAPATVPSNSRLATFQSPLDRLCPPVSIVTIPPSALPPSFCPIPPNSPPLMIPNPSSREGDFPLCPPPPFIPFPHGVWPSPPCPSPFPNCVGSPIFGLPPRWHYSLNGSPSDCPSTSTSPFVAHFTHLALTILPSLSIPFPFPISQCLKCQNRLLYLKKKLSQTKPKLKYFTP